MSPQHSRHCFGALSNPLPTLKSRLPSALEADGSATLKVYRNPLVNWIWIGALVLMLGTIAILWPHSAQRPELRNE